MLKEAEMSIDFLVKNGIAAQMGRWEEVRQGGKVKRKAEAAESEHGI